MITCRDRVPTAVARRYFAAQAVGGLAWWIAVAASHDVRVWTLGGWNPAVIVGPDLILFVGASAWAAARGSRWAAVTAAGWTAAITLALTIYGLVERVAGWGVVLMAVATLGSVAAAATIWFGHLPTGWFFVGPFSFRVADEGAHHVRRSLAQLVVFWTTFFVVVPALLTVVERRLQLRWDALARPGVALAGWTMFGLASALGLWSCLTMAARGRGTPLPAATARELVVEGPYRYVRNPMALAGLVQTAGVGLVLGSWTVVVVAVAGALTWNWLIRPTEEADLVARFGQPYRTYAERVRCWIPCRTCSTG